MPKSSGGDDSNSDPGSQQYSRVTRATEQDAPRFQRVLEPSPEFAGGVLKQIRERLSRVGGWQRRTLMHEQTTRSKGDLQSHAYFLRK